MSIESEVAKIAVGGAKQSAWKFWQWWRTWRTKKAYEREVEREMKKHVKAEQLKRGGTLSALVILVALSSGCASLDKVYTSIDRTVYNGVMDPYQNQVPDGYVVRPYILNAAGDRVDVTGWTVKEEIVPSASWKPLLLTSILDRKPTSNPLADVVSVISGQPAKSGSADAAIQALRDAAVKEGVE